MPTQHEHYIRLCALFTSGELSKDEQSQLNTHLGHCESCSRLLKSYRAVVKSGIALIGLLHEPAPAEEVLTIQSAQERLMERIAAGRRQTLPEGRQ